MEFGWDEVRARRLLRSSLDERASGDRLVEVVRAVCGVHAQVQASAERDMKQAKTLDEAERARVALVTAQMRQRLAGKKA